MLFLKYSSEPALCLVCFLLFTLFEETNAVIDKRQGEHRIHTLRLPQLIMGAIVLIFMVEGARVVISFCILSAMPGYMVVPPDRTVLAYRSFLISTSHFMMEL